MISLYDGVNAMTVLWTAVQSKKSGVTPWGRHPCRPWPQPRPATALREAVPLGVEDGVVATEVVGLEDLGSFLVVPAAALGEVAEDEPPPARQGDHGAASAVAAGPQRVGEG